MSHMYTKERVLLHCLSINICLRNPIRIIVDTSFSNTLNCTPVSWLSPKTILINCCNILFVSFLEELGEGGAYIMVESLPNLHPTRFRFSTDRHHLKFDPCPESIIQLSRGILTISQIVGYDLLPCPSPLGGGFRGTAHISPP